MPEAAPEAEGTPQLACHLGDVGFASHAHVGPNGLHRIRHLGVQRPEIRFNAFVLEFAMLH